MSCFRRLRAQSFRLSGAFLLAFAAGCGASSTPDAAVTGGAAPSGAGMSSVAAGTSSMAGAGVSGSGTGGAAGGESAGTASGGAAAGGGAGPSGGGGSSAGAGAGAGGSGGGTATNPSQRKLLLRDEGNSAVHYVDLADATKNWHQAVPVGRDLQLIGGHKFLIGTDNGYQERNLSDGSLAKDVSDYPGTLAAHRLHNGNTLLTGVDFHGGKGIVLLELTPGATVVRQIEYPGSYVRLVRETGTDHFLVTADTHVFEGDAQGKVVWDATVQGGPAMPHAWEALRLASGDVLVATGYAASLEVFGADQQLKQTITGGEGVNPYFFADVQVMPGGGSYVVANWQGHGTGLGAMGLQVVEYDTAGKLIWSWKQDASFVSSLQQVVVLDALDLDKLQVENPQSGVLEAAP